MNWLQKLICKILPGSLPQHGPSTESSHPSSSPASQAIKTKPDWEPVPPEPGRQSWPSPFNKALLVNVAVEQANKNLVWTPGSEACKFTKKFEHIFGTKRFSWCACFVTWCLEQSHLNVPTYSPSKFGYTFALCEAWQQWAIENGFYIDNSPGLRPLPGDLVLFDWNQTSIDAPDLNWENHIGVVVSVWSGDTIKTAEGNTSNKTAIKLRKTSLVQGYIRIPDGYEFPPFMLKNGYEFKP